MNTPPFSLQRNDVVLRDPAQRNWLLFRSPVQVLIAKRIDEVIPVLRHLDREIGQGNLFAAGFVAYEAAPALDPALQTWAPRSLPLVWFGLYRQPDILPCLPSTAAVFPMAFPSWSAALSREEYDASIDQIKSCIARGDTYQVNYTYRLNAVFQGDPLAYFLFLAKAQDAPYAACVNGEEFAVLSASPELFFRVEGELITSRPMKGTAPRGRTLAEDREQSTWLYNSEKNRAENVMIVDMVRNDIGKIARTGSVGVPELFCVEKYPTVWQMVSTVTGETAAPPSEIFRALFPAASITGAPKARTMQIIRKLESSPRQVYTGCIGYFSPQCRAQFNVAIRTVLIDKLTSQAEYGVGGGITWDSVDAAEYEECQIKAKILAVRMPTFSLLESLLWTPAEGYFLLDRHLSRLLRSAEYFSFPANRRAIEDHLIEAAQSFGGEMKKVRLLVDQAGKITIQAEGLRLEPGKILHARLAPAPVDASDPFLFHKTTNRQVYDQARLSCEADPGGPWEEVLLWNEKGEISEFTTGNILVELGEEFYTPPLECGLLPGVYREWLLERGEAKERVIRIEELSSARRVVFINSVRKRQEVRGL